MGISSAVAYGLNNGRFPSLASYETLSESEQAPPLNLQEDRSRGARHLHLRLPQLLASQHLHHHHGEDVKVPSPSTAVRQKAAQAARHGESWGLCEHQAYASCRRGGTGI